MSTATELERGRASYAKEAWLDAFQAFASADKDDRLDAEDLESLARSAYMLGRDDTYVAGLKRAHYAHLEAGDVPRAVRCAIWIGHSFLFRGELAHSAGWFVRAQRLLNDDGRDCVEQGYVLIPVWLEQLGSGEYEAGYATAAEAAAVGERFGDSDLTWLARHDQAGARVKQGRVKEGLQLVDEALVIAIAGELSPIVTGIVFCNTISFCRDVYELRHVREWTEALTVWCERQPEMVTHNGLCFVHRAEMKLLGGAWESALGEARLCTERFREGILNRLATGNAFYIEGEAHRRRGDLVAAEAAYREASRCGREPQPGLALLRLTQGEADAAAAAIRRLVGETTEPLSRAGLLPAYVEIMVAIGNFGKARGASSELDEISERWGSEMLTGMAAQARGTIDVAEGHAEQALPSLRKALGIWNELGALHEAARVRMLIGVACRALDDDDSATLEFETAREAFESMGAVLDQLRVESLTAKSPPGHVHGLTVRELAVLRLVASGKSNREIADDLTISERTVARHIQNIFAKLDVSSRTAATAFAFSHDLV
jgi:DNA-binding CsgD family transcriptional regulator